jgi:uncharacterized delta-60 repeat protein
MRRLAPIAVAVWLLCTAVPAFAYGAAPDPTFGANGVVTYSTDVFRAVVVQERGWTYVAYSTRNGALTVERRDSTGSLDASFGSAGSFTTVVNTGSLVGATTANDGSVYLVYVPYNAATTYRVMRITSGGSHDLTYGAKGAAGTRMTAADTATALAVDATGRLYIGGKSAPRRGKPVAFVIRLTAAGAMDRTFSDDGRRGFGGLPNSGAAGLAVRAHSVVVVGAQARIGFATRVRENGSLDRTFGNHGYQLVKSRVGSLALTSVTVRPSLQVVGVVKQAKPRQEWLIAGPLFGRRHRLRLCPGCLVTASSAIGPDGSVVTAGARPHLGSYRPFLAGLLPSGAPDTGLSATGYAFIGRSSPARPMSVAIDGSALLVSTMSGSPTEGATLARFLPTP